MGMRWSVLAEKELIDLVNGERLGLMGQADLVVDPGTGKVKSLVLSSGSSLFSEKEGGNHPGVGEHPQSRPRDGDRGPWQGRHLQLVKDVYFSESAPRTRFFMEPVFWGGNRWFAPFIRWNQKARNFFSRWGGSRMELQGKGYRKDAGW